MTGNVSFSHMFTYLTTSEKLMVSSSYQDWRV